MNLNHALFRDLISLVAYELFSLSELFYRIIQITFLYGFFVHMICGYGLWVWFVRMVCAYGFCVWFVRMVCAYGLCVWFVHMVAYK